MPLFDRLGSWPRRPQHLPAVPRLTRVAMADPSGFDVVEAINVHMKDEAGSLRRVDKEKAQAQWQALAIAYRRLGVELALLPALPGHPDFCFAANPSLVLPLPDGSREMWMSRMTHASRVGEVAAHREFGKQVGLTIREMPTHVLRFEGTGDGILHPGRFLLHGGVSPRTSRAAWAALSQAHPEMDVLLYRMENPKYYHLDTALAPLDEQTALIVPQAFETEGLEMVRAAFPRFFEIPPEEGALFAGNAHCPDGKHVLLQSGCKVTEAWLRANGFEPVPLDTSEFLKSGGSVFCLKLAW